MGFPLDSKRGMMKFKIFIIISLIFVISCIRILTLDSFLFGPTEVDEYFDVDVLREWDSRLIIPDSLVEEVVLSSMGYDIYGFFVKGNPDSVSNNQITFLYCHGKDENINRYWFQVEHFWEMGYNTFIFDFQGYGKSQGEPSGDALYSDGEEALDYVLSRTDVDTDRIVYYGMSLGTFVATYLAADIRHPAALIIESAPASITELLHDSGLIKLSGSYVADADFDNVRRIDKINCPLFMLHGEDDSFTAFERHVPMIWNNAVEPKEHLWVEGSDHSEIIETLGDEYNEAIIDFIKSYVF